MIPWAVEPSEGGGVAVHTILSFSGSCESGKAAARNLHVKLLGNVGSLFPVHVFGTVHMEAISHPYLVSSCGWLAALLCLFNTCNTLAMFPAGERMGGVGGP